MEGIKIAPMTATERSRLTRQRRSYGGCVVPVEIYETEIDQLVAAGLLSETEREDRMAIGRAIEKWMEISSLKPA